MLRYDTITGKFIDIFINDDEGHMDCPEGLLLLEDRLLVASFLNDKVLKKYLGIKLDKAQIEELCSIADGAAERLLLEIKTKLDSGAAPPVRKQRHASSPEPPIEGGVKGKVAPAGARLAAPSAEPHKGNRRAGGNAQHDTSLAERASPTLHRGANHAVDSGPAERPSPHPPVGPNR